MNDNNVEEAIMSLPEESEEGDVAVEVNRANLEELKNAPDINKFILQELKALDLPYNEGMELLADKFCLTTNEMWGLFKGSRQIENCIFKQHSKS